MSFKVGTIKDKSLNHSFLNKLVDQRYPSHIYKNKKFLKFARNKTIKQHLATYQARLDYNISIDEYIDRRKKPLLL